ncbi:hypothetical protein AJ88_15905 [Mesorhizobium amorphae CCBAU 01583]|nr:hypothetical protein AJ88_15905 [Mesorhizobium amorphae CCBAU 01583]
MTGLGDITLQERDLPALLFKRPPRPGQRHFRGVARGFGKLPALDSAGLRRRCQLRACLQRFDGLTGLGDNTLQERDLPARLFKRPPRPGQRRFRGIARRFGKLPALDGAGLRCRCQLRACLQRFDGPTGLRDISLQEPDLPALLFKRLPRPARDASAVLRAATPSAASSRPAAASSRGRSSPCALLVLIASISCCVRKLCSFAARSRSARSRSSFARTCEASAWARAASSSMRAALRPRLNASTQDRSRARFCSAAAESIWAPFGCETVTGGFVSDGTSAIAANPNSTRQIGMKGSGAAPDCLRSS